MVFRVHLNDLGPIVKIGFHDFNFSKGLQLKASPPF
jgi:hypothetical protein